MAKWITEVWANEIKICITFFLLISLLACKIGQVPTQRGGRVVEGARLESVYTPKGYRGFESLPLCRVLELLIYLRILHKI